MLIGLMVVALINFTKESAMCVFNPLNYTEQKYPDMMCSCYPRTYWKIP